MSIENRFRNALRTKFGRGPAAAREVMARLGLDERMLRGASDVVHNIHTDPSDEYFDRGRQRDPGLSAFDRTRRRGRARDAEPDEEMREREREAVFGEDRHRHHRADDDIHEMVEHEPEQNLAGDDEEEADWTAFDAFLRRRGFSDDECSEARRIVEDSRRRRMNGGHDRRGQADDRFPARHHGHPAMDAMRLMRRITIEPTNNPQRLAQIAMDRKPMTEGQRQRMNQMFPGLSRIGVA